MNNVALGNHPIQVMVGDRCQTLTVQIPSDFPGILKQYTKAAIRTQPRDLLLWSAAYFRCLARGEHPPAKDRLEYPVPESDTGQPQNTKPLPTERSNQHKSAIQSKFSYLVFIC